MQHEQHPHTPASTDTGIAADTATGTTPATQPPAPARRPRLLRTSARLALGAAVVLLLAAIGLWCWLGAQQSLAQALALLQRHMPAGTSLQVEGVRGNLLQGGHIDKLIYRQHAPAPANANAPTPSGALTLTFEHIDIAWDWTALRHRATRLRRLHIRSLTYADTRPPHADSSPPLRSLTLPVSVDAPFAIDALLLPATPANPPASAATSAATSSSATAASAAPSAVAAKTTTLHQLAGRYRYSQPQAQHRLEINSVQWQPATAASATTPTNTPSSASRLRLQATLGGQTPMPLHLQASATLPVPAAPALATSSASAASTPTASPSPAEQTLRISLQATGTLAQPEGSLRVTGSLQTQTQNTTAQAAQAQLQATLHPWQPQPLTQASLQWQNLNLHAFLPTLPHTLLGGALELHPISPATLAQQHSQPSKPSAIAPAVTGQFAALGAGHWRLALQAHNAQAGAWDKNLLPLHSLQTQLEYHNGALTMPALHWQPSASAASHITAHAQYQPQHGWQASINAHALAPADFYSPLASNSPNNKTNDKISGTFELQSAPLPKPSADNAPLNLALSLQTERPSQPNSTQIKLQGQWQQHTLTLPSIFVKTRDATLQGSASYQTHTQTAQTDLQLAAPGAQAQLKGQIAPASGQGQLHISASDIQKTLLWLAPYTTAPALHQYQASGTATLAAHWRGGWQAQGSTLQLNANLDAPAITLQAKPLAASSAQNANSSATATSATTPAPAITTIRNTRIALQGTLAKLQLNAQTQAQQNGLALQLALQGQAGILPKGWQAQLQATQLQFLGKEQGRPWQATLQAPLQLALRQNADTFSASSNAFEIGMRSAISNTTRLQAQPIRFVQQGNSYQISSQGQLHDIPLLWANAISQRAAHTNVLSGDMLLSGAWNVQLNQQLHIEASLQRSSGDLIVLTGDGSAPNNAPSSPTSQAVPRSRGRIPAGVRTARLALQSHGTQLQATLDWDSANAGSAHASLGTQLARTASGWTLPATAPLQGSLQAQMPRVGMWNLFAPPGWRLRGTLDADLRLSGTLQTPLLHGNLNARDLGVRSIVDGFAFSQGKLRTRFTGQRMEIDEFSLQGTPNQTGLLEGGKIDGGNAHISGHVQWGNAPDNTTNTATSSNTAASAKPASLLQSLQIQLKTRLNRLQIFAQPQRLLVLSGEIDTRLAALQLHMRGGLNVNRALIDLPSDFAPQLDTDVVILPSKKHPKSALAQPRASNTSQATSAATQPAPTAPTLGGDVIIKPASQAHTAAPATATIATTAATQATRKQRPPTAPPSTTVATAPAPSSKASANPAIEPNIQISIDLGNAFRLRGYGLDAHLNGKLALQNTSTITAMPLLTGTIQTERGTFRAYGQDLQIERGRITFTGSPDNPTLDIAAIRPNLDFEVGVQIRGSAQRPLVQLYSEPPMPDSERLSWLVLGRSSSSVADTALLQKAALALLGGNQRGISGQLADALGLDEIGFGSGNANTAQTSGAIASGSVKLGKRFGKNAYIAYEKGLDATLGTLSFFYDINRFLKLRGQTGQQSSVDLIYSISYD